MRDKFKFAIDWDMSRGCIPVRLWVFNRWKFSDEIGFRILGINVNLTWKPKYKVGEL